MNDTQFPKYQADWSIGTQMFHVRCNDLTEFKEAVKQMEAIIPAAKSFPDDEGPQAKTANGNGKQCPVHGATVAWKEGVSKKTGNPYGFFSCTAKNADGSWCNAKIT